MQKSGKCTDSCKHTKINTQNHEGADAKLEERCLRPAETQEMYTMELTANENTANKSANLAHAKVRQVHELVQTHNKQHAKWTMIHEHNHSWTKSFRIMNDVSFQPTERVSIK